MSQFLDKRFWSRLLLVTAAALSLGVMATSSASAQRDRDDDDEKSDSNRVFSPDIGEIVSDAQEKMNADPPDQTGAMDDLNRALEHRGVSAFEVGVILQLRAYLKYQLEDVQGALADWNRALTDGDLNDTERLGVMYYVGQVYLSEGDYQEAVDRLEEWIRLGGAVTDKVHLNLVAAYVELGDHQTNQTQTNVRVQDGNVTTGMLAVADGDLAPIGALANRIAESFGGVASRLGDTSERMNQLPERFQLGIALIEQASDTQEAAVEETATIEPPPRRTIARPAYLIIRKIGRTFSSIVRLKSSSS